MEPFRAPNRFSVRSILVGSHSCGCRSDGAWPTATSVLRAIAAAANELSGLIELGRLYGQLGASRASTNTDGDVQKERDVLATELFVGAFR